MEGAFYNAGQSCCAVERIYVARPVFARFVEAYVNETRAWRVGDPEDPTTKVGPLAHAGGRTVVEEQIGEASAKGARVLMGGRRPDRRGWFLEPTVLVDVDHSMAVMREESFGPVIGIMPVADDDEGVHLMNDSPYDRCDYLDPMLPWVGVKDSGKGCSLSHLGFQHLTRPKSFSLAGGQLTRSTITPRAPAVSARGCGLP